MENNRPRMHVFFNTGDIVELKQDIPNKPRMIVSKINRIRPTEKSSDRNVLLGVSCFWFSQDGIYQERIFSSKDLNKL